MRAAFALPAAWLRVHRTRLAALFAGVLVPLYLFGELASRIREPSGILFDEEVLRFMQRHATPWLDQAMLLASVAGSGPWITAFDALVCGLLLARRCRLQALYWALATGGAALLNHLAKHRYARERPDLWVSIAPEQSFSFPSGHAMQSMAVAAALAVLLWRTRLRWPALLAGAAFALAVGASRLYLGVHFPSDVAAGWCASLAWAIGLGLLFPGLAARMPRAGAH